MEFCLQDAAASGWAVSFRMCLLIPGEVNQPYAGGPSCCRGAGFGKNQAQLQLLSLHLAPNSSSTPFFLPCTGTVVPLLPLGVFNDSSKAELGFLCSQQ